jgi:hypothetical protein
MESILQKPTQDGKAIFHPAVLTVTAFALQEGIPPGIQRLISGRSKGHLSRYSERFLFPVHRNMACTVSRRGFFQARVGALGAAAAGFRDLQRFTQVAHRPRTVGGGTLDIAVSHGMAYADVHGRLGGSLRGLHPR